jgi:two-component system chemotaxis response regulator CheY
VKLLIVDDSSIVRRTILRSLEIAGIEQVFEACNGRQALEIFTAEVPDLVTMDITMPEMDGLSCVSRIIDLHPSARILVISALGDETTAMEAVERGANGYVYKPFTAEELNEAFAELLASPSS